MANQTKLSSFFSVKTSSPLAQKSRNVDILTPTKRALTSNEAKGSKKLKENNPTATVLSTITSPKVVSFAPKTNGLVTRFGLSWKPCLEKEFAKDYFQKLSEFVKQEKTKHTIYPKIEDVFAWTTACRLNDVKVVILGQDPYHGVNQAHGVLLLNSVLTVRAGLANSHKDKGWETLTDAVIHYLNTNTTNTVFILWGSYAQKKGGHINKSKHCVLKGVHPSPLAAHRGFFGCKHFSQANKYLQTHNKSPVDWNLLPAQS
ncbi:uracil-DNA glycosylase-like isoform X2 [Watersipora subatra]|uniref:uracil-DNA glycosylase-like isoform X2 n=1 Tax=Watersipora subatra TaxID=2589382 RepID=UPI00355ADAD1